MDNDSQLQMAVLAEICGRSDDMRSFMKNFIENVNADLNDWQRDLFSICYKETMMKKRKSIKILQHTFTYAPEDECFTENYEKRIFEEMREIQEEVVSLIEDKLEAKARDTESRGFYVKMKADYYRYIAEVARGDTRTEFAELSKNFYTEAMAVLAGEKMSVLRVGLTLNYSVFLYEVNYDIAAACEMAQKALENAVLCCQESKEEGANEYLQELISLLSENVKIWSETKVYEE